MPSIATMERNEYAVYWETIGLNKFGKPTISPPIEIRVRWENSKSTMIGKDRQPLAIDATVVVDRELVDDSILWLGKLEDLPTTPSNLMQIKTLTSVTDIKGKHTRRVAYASEYGNTLPVVIEPGTGD